MTALSLPAASSAPPPIPMKANAGPAQDDVSANSTFKDLLNTSGDDAPEETDAKMDEPKTDNRLPQSVIVAIFAAMSAATPAGAFGLPSQGDEAGAVADAAKTTTTALPAETDTPLNLPVAAPAPSSEDTASVLQAELAFALRLVDQSPDAEVNTTGRPRAGEAGRSLSAIGASLDDMGSKELAANSGSSLPDNSSRDKESTNGAAKPDHVKTERRDSASPAVETSAFRETTSTLSGTAPVTALSASVAQPAREASAAANVAAPAEPSTAAASTLQPQPTPEVTDVSVTIPLQGKESGPDERVAIRMVQRGGEIHVSVRTPDQQAAQSLRQDLSRLASSLDQAGFRADTWRPAAAHVAAPSETHGQREFSQERPHSDSSGSDAQPGRHNGRGAGEQKRRQQDDRPRWVAELERRRG